jgi:hypothetical protein
VAMVIVYFKAILLIENINPLIPSKIILIDNIIKNKKVI